MALYSISETNISTTEQVVQSLSCPVFSLTHISPLSAFSCNNTCVLLQSLMNTNKEDMRELAAQLYAVVVSTMTGSELQTAVHNLLKITKDNHVWRFVSSEHLASQECAFGTLC